MIIKVM